ncbi:MAG: DMT family transporter [Rickettsiales bacterium]
MKMKGYLYAFITVILWSGWAIVTRLGVKSDLTPMDITFLRFGTAGFLMLPIAYKNRQLITRKNIWLLLVMIIGAGPPYLLICSLGFASAPATHSVIIPCTMSLFVAVICYSFFKDKISAVSGFGYMAILCGVAFKLSLSEYIFADLYFIGGGLLFAIFTIFSRKTGFAPLVTTAFVSSGSMLLLVVPYMIYQIYNPHEMNIGASIFQIVYQGIITSIISLLTYNLAVKYIGTTSTSAFAALVPVMVTIGAIPILGEIPNQDDIIFVCLMTIGVLLASGICNKLFHRNQYLITHYGTEAN